MDLRTDLEKLTALFNQFGVGYEQYEFESYGTIQLKLTAKVHEKVEGYTDFSSAYIFDKEDEHFIRVEIFE